MGIGISVVIGAIGAILRYAFTGPVNQQGFDLHTGGVILMIVGIVGVVLSMLFWSNFAPFGRSRISRREEIVSRDGRESGHVVRETTRDVAN